MRGEIDIETLSHKLGFETEDVMMLLELFGEAAQSSLAQIEDAIEANDYATIAKEAHSIKGSSANLALADIVDIARELEMYAQRHKADQVRSLFQDLEAMIEKVIETGYCYA